MPVYQGMHYLTMSLQLGIHITSIIPLKGPGRSRWLLTFGLHGMLSVVSLALAVKFEL